jgi:AraC-like DNA-binding protein
VDEGGPGEQDPVMLPPDTQVRVRIERGRTALLVTASAVEGAFPLRVEATFSAGAEGVWLKVVRAGSERVFSSELVAQHRAIAAILRLVGDEAELSKPPNEALLGFLFKSLLVYVARMAQPVPRPRWGRPIRNRRIERALELLRADLSKYWTVSLLARAVGLSRPVFAREFVRMLQLSPMRYLTNQRMAAAAQLLCDTDASLAEIAMHVGYRSEFAFGRAFKRHHQVAPGTYRRHATVAHGGTALLAA